MSHTFTFPLAAPLPGPAPGGSGASAGPAGASAPYARALDPVTGDVLFDDAHSTWVAGDPDAQIILRCLLTPLGSAARDPTYGIEWSRLDNAVANAGAVARQVIDTGLARWTARGLFRVLDVQAEAVGDALFVSLEFLGRAGVRQTLRVQVR